MLRARPIPALGLALLLLGCGDDTTATGGAPTGGSNTGGEAPIAGAPPTGGTGGEAPTCFENEVPLLIDTQRLYVPVEVDGEAGLFFIDTGSSLTFLNLGPDGPAFVEDAATLAIGCETLSIPARGGLQLLPDAFGQPVLGYLGADYLIESTSLLDVPGERVVRPINQPIAAEASSWPVLAYDDVQGHIIAPVLLDATPVRLMLDTGAFHTLWLGQQGEPGDQEIETADAEGNPLFFFLGEVDLEMAARDVVSVPVLRAPSFPYFEQTVASLGGNIHGLLGLTSFRERAMMFDGAAHEVRLGPVPQLAYAASVSHSRAALALLLPMVAACAGAPPAADKPQAEPVATGPRVEALPAPTPAEIEALGWLDTDAVDVASGKAHTAAAEALAAARSELLLCLRTDDATKPKAWQVASADKSGVVSLAAAATPEPPAAACLREKLTSLKLPATSAGIAVSVAIDSTPRAAATTPQNEIGSLLGDSAGDAFGASGLGMTGTGVGGGGIATGIGLGNTKPGTIGGGGNPVAGGGGGAPAGPPAKPKQPTIVVDKPAVRGSIPEAVVSRIVRQNMGRFRHCYESSLRANPNLRGRIETTFTINTSGDVVTSKSSSADLNQAEMLTCVQRSFMGMSFPKADGLVTVRFPIMFAPPGAPAPTATNKAPELPAEPAPRAKTIAGKSFDKLDGASITTKLGRASREVRLVPIAPAIVFVREDNGEIAVVARVSGAVQSACAVSDAGFSVVVQASDEPSCKSLLRELLD